MLDAHGKPNEKTPTDWQMFYLNEDKNNIVKKSEVS